MYKKLGFSLLYLGFVAFGLGCASYMKRQECEKTNWYQLGYSTAMKGERVTSEPLVGQCEKADGDVNYADLDLGFKSGMGNYCKPETVLQTGKDGKPFKDDLCDPSLARKLHEKHQEGVQIFCNPINAKMFGATGGKYLNVCPKELEAGFLLEYHKGREIYLEGAISYKEKSERDHERDLEVKRREYDRLSYQLAAFRPRQRQIFKDIVDAKSGKVKRQMVIEEDPSSISERQMLNNQISTTQAEIRKLEYERDVLRKEIEEMSQELRALKNG